MAARRCGVGWDEAGVLTPPTLLVLLAPVVLALVLRLVAVLLLVVRLRPDRLQPARPGGGPAARAERRHLRDDAAAPADARHLEPARLGAGRERLALPVAEPDVD